MTPRQTLLAMADWYKTRSFSPRYESGEENCGCFAHALNAVTGCYSEIPNVLWEMIGGGISEEWLIARGWTDASATRDAEAACRIAADLATGPEDTR